MAKLDTDRIFRALGSMFTAMFTAEDRLVLRSYWEAWADLTADLWGLAFQVDQTKSVFSTSATVERRNVLVQLSRPTVIPGQAFALASVHTEPVGNTTSLRGFVPRDQRTFRARDIPAQGLIRIGVDTLPYVAANVIVVDAGAMAGYVQEATFTLDASTLPHDYADTIDLNDSFFRQELQLAFRVPQVPGQTFVDSTGLGLAPDLNSTGRLRFGTAGINLEEHQYQSLSVVGDRYVFTLPATWSPGQSGPSALSFSHPEDEVINVSVLSPSRWVITTSGSARVYGDDAAVMVVDDSPGAIGASQAALASELELQENTDFDVAINLFPELWPTVAASERRAGVRLDVGGQVLGLYLRQTASALAYVANGQVLAITARPDQVELRLSRQANVLELTVREPGDGEPKLVASVAVSGARARLTLFLADDGTDTAARVRFDEVVRRLGQAAGSQRLESTFVVDERFPYRYATDVQLTSAVSLADDPKPRAQDLVTVAEITADGFDGVVMAMGAGDDFEAMGVPAAGELALADKVMVYDSFTRDGPVFHFAVRGAVDPDLLPLAAGAVAVARTRALGTDTGFRVPAPGELWLRDAPTRLRLWAPVAQEDQRFVQRLWAPLVGLTAEASSEALARRVQGAWYALMAGPAIENVRIGVHLAVGLPAAKVAGVVQRIFTRQDTLGRVVERGMVILGDNGASVTHTLDARVQGVDWAFAPGQAVERFAPLTTGVAVYDALVQDDWPVRFGLDPLSPERYNAFGVMVDLGVLNGDTSLDDAIRFALRIKPTWAKMFFHLLLTAGNEHLVVEDDGMFAVVANFCEDISFDEGAPPLEPQPSLRMGEGHKMGQGLHMHVTSVFSAFPTLGLGLHMGTGLTMGMPDRAFVCYPDEDNLAREELTTTVVVEVDAGA